MMPCLLVAISWSERLKLSRDGPRGARHQARTSRHELVSGGSGRTPTTMQSSASAAKLRGGGPILKRGTKAMRNTGWLLSGFGVVGMGLPDQTRDEGAEQSLAP